MSSDISITGDGPPLTEQQLVFSGSSSSSRQHEKRETKHFILYSLYGWGMPLTIVATCLSVNVTTSIDIGYGKK